MDIHVYNLFQVPAYLQLLQNLYEKLRKDL
jgi:hypothetical protein